MNKLIPLKSMSAEIHSGDTIALSGGGLVRKTIVSAEKVTDTKQIEARFADTAILRVWTAKVAEAPGGSGFTSCYPNFPVNLSAVQNYLEQAGSPERFRDYLEKNVLG